MILLELFFEFFKVGLFAVGGGLATLPFLYELAEKGWYSTEFVSTMLAISESTPGPIGINMSTYVGYLQSGVLGSIIAPLGEVTPSIIIIMIIAKFLQKFKENRAFQDAFYGLRSASTAMIVAAGLGIFKIAFFGESYTHFFWQGGILAVILFIAMRKFKFHPVVYIAFSAIVGIIFKFSI